MQYNGVDKRQLAESRQSNLPAEQGPAEDGYEEAAEGQGATLGLREGNDVRKNNRAPK